METDEDNSSFSTINPWSLWPSNAVFFSCPLAPLLSHFPFLSITCLGCCPKQSHSFSRDHTSDLSSKTTLGMIGANNNAHVRVLHWNWMMKKCYSPTTLPWSMCLLRGKGVVWRERGLLVGLQPWWCGIGPRMRPSQSGWGKYHFVIMGYPSDRAGESWKRIYSICPYETAKGFHDFI